MATPSVNIFISSAPTEKADRDSLIKALHPSVLQLGVRLWSRQDVLPSDETSEVVAKQIDAATVVVLLLSKDFLADENCYEEAVQALNKSRCVLGVRVRDFLRLKEDPVASLQLLSPTQKRPLTKFRQRDEAWVEVANGILAAAGISAITLAPPPASKAAQDSFQPMDLVGDALFEASFLDPVALRCNRHIQWGELDSLVSDKNQACLILVPGELGKGHTYFLQRVGRQLRRDPSRHIVSVSWDSNPFPSCEREYYEQLAAALHCKVVGLEEQLIRILSHHNLILIHRPVEDKFPCGAEEAAQSIRLFRHWLPNLMKSVRNGNRHKKQNASLHAIKCLQPIAWPSVSPLWKWMARTVTRALGYPPRIMERWLAGDLAKRFLHELESAPIDEFTIQQLAELSDITDEDLRGVCRTAAIPPVHWSRLIHDARRNGPTPRELLLCLSKLLRDPTLKANP